VETPLPAKEVVAMEESFIALALIHVSHLIDRVLKRIKKNNRSSGKK